MIYEYIEACKQPIKIELSVNNCDCVISCVDANDYKRRFFALAKQTTTPKNYTFQLPVTSEKLLLMIDGNCKVNDFFITTFQSSVNQSDEAFIQFIELFAYDAHKAKRGMYYDDNYSIDVIRFMNHTPCRVDISTRVIEFSQSYLKQTTIPRIVLLGLHERAHMELNSNAADEFEADRLALDIYLRRGHIRHEGFEAFASIFSATSQNVQRTQTILNSL